MRAKSYETISFSYSLVEMHCESRLYIMRSYLLDPLCDNFDDLEKLQTIQVLDTATHIQFNLFSKEQAVDLP